MVEENNPLVSIRVITYNSSKFVLETLESAKAQTYQNIELIVSDDCSTDNTVEICREWIENNKDRFVRTELITVEKNTGIPSNCNRAVKACRGEWIKGIAGDDILLPHCIEENIKYAKNNNADFVFSDMLYFNEKTELPEDSKLNKLIVKFNNTSDKLRFYSRLPIFLNSPTWFMLNKDIIYDETYKLLDDQPFIFNLINAKRKIIYLDIKTIKYRKHPESVQKDKKIELMRNIHKCYKEYRSVNLSIYNFWDNLFVLNFYIGYLYAFASEKFITKLMVYPIVKLNPIRILNITPSIGLK